MIQNKEKSIKTTKGNWSSGMISRLQAQFEKVGRSIRSLSIPFCLFSTSFYWNMDFMDFWRS